MYHQFCLHCVALLSLRVEKVDKICVHLKPDSDLSIYRKYVRDFSGKSNLAKILIIRLSFFKVCAVCRNKNSISLL